jgi:hypothetical protein
VLTRGIRTLRAVNCATTTLNLLVLATKPRKRDRCLLYTGVTGYWVKKLACGVRGLRCLGSDWLCGELVVNNNQGCEVRYAERGRPGCRGFAVGDDLGEAIARLG